MIIDLFAGPGGWSEGLASLGHHDIGIEWDYDACRTRRAAGHLAVRADVSELPLEHLEGKVTGLIASPPCTAFSQAGAKDGIEHIDALVQAIQRRDWSALRDQPPTVWLPLEVGRWVEGVRPTWLACEQVPGCLPLWESYELVLRDLGYRTWAGVLNAADFGVPQTRKRAYLLASLDRQPQPPEPTHAREEHNDLFGTRQRWTSMAQALGWGMTARPSVPLVAASGDGGPRPLDGGAGAREALRRAQDDGTWVVATGMNGMKHGRDITDLEPYERPIDEPAPTLTGASGGAWTVGEEGHRQPPHAFKVGFQRRSDRDPDAEYRDRDLRDGDMPAFALTEKARSWKLIEAQANGAERDADEPAMTITGSADNGNFRFVLDRRADYVDGKPGAPLIPDDQPAPTISGKAGDSVWEIRPLLHVPSEIDVELTRGTTFLDGLRRLEAIELEDAGELPEPGQCAIELVQDDTYVGRAEFVHSPLLSAPEWIARRNDQSNAGEVDVDWPADRPATVVATRDIVPDPGTNANRFNGAGKSRNDGVKITVRDALLLQSFREDYPVQGTKTSQFRQVGNAVCPRMAARLLAQFV